MKKRIDTTGTAAGAPLHRPFAGLAERLGLSAAPPPSSAPADPVGSRAPDAPPARAVVRLERKGRGGKTATIVEKLDLAPEERDRWLAELKRALGCGGAAEGDALVLQGDVRERVRRLLEARGVRKVTLG